MRVVLDTNVVLDLFHWDDGAAAPLLQAARAGRIALLTDARCLRELRRVLARPPFALDAAAAEALVGRYLQLATVHEAAASSQAAALPRCKDPDDQKFLELARDAGADLLVTRDKALLKLARRKFALGAFRILPPQRWQAEADGGEAAQAS
jgi:putative PIN family toxin of toxin-antitoxin system